MQEVRIPFKKWDLIAWVNSHNSETRLAITPICEAIGIAWQPQHEKLKNDPRFNPHDIVSVGADGKQREMLTLPASQIGGWLYTINSRKVKPEVAPLLLEFQKFCVDAIYAATSGHANREVVEALKSEIIRLTNLLSTVMGEVAELREQVVGLKRHQDMMIDPINMSVSNAARALRNGHIKSN